MKKRKTFNLAALAKSEAFDEMMTKLAQTADPKLITLVKKYVMYTEKEIQDVRLEIQGLILIQKRADFRQQERAVNAEQIEELNEVVEALQQDRKALVEANEELQRDNERLGPLVVTQLATITQLQAQLTQLEDRLAAASAA